VDSTDRSRRIRKLELSLDTLLPLLVPEPYGQPLAAYGSLPISSSLVTVTQLARLVTPDGKSDTKDSECFLRVWFAQFLQLICERQENTGKMGEYQLLFLCHVVSF